MTKKFFTNNIAFGFYFLFSWILELVTVSITTESFFISKPWLMLLYLGVIFFIYNLIPHRTVKRWFLVMFFILQCIINLVCVTLFENTGTVFDFNMFRLISETVSFAGTVTINYWYVAYMLLMIAVYCLCVSVLGNKADKYYSVNWLVCLLCIICLVVGQTTYIIKTNQISEENFIRSLYRNSNDKYSIYGATSNFANEVSKMLFFNKYNTLSSQQISNYIYENVNTKTEYFGISKNNNLVTILVESFEWFSFISNPDIYPNGANLSNEKLDALYPNLRKFYNMSVVMNNHYSQNKTDMSEDEALLGSYPSNAYINYSYPSNSFNSSIASMIKISDTNIRNNFFHNNKKGFYNRENVATSLGYDNLYFIEEMKEYGVVDYLEELNITNTAMNKDSEMFDKMRDVMFPSTGRFNTHITTISMHGDYLKYRTNLEEYYDKLDSLNISITNDYLKNYMVSVMDFDKAVGIMLDDLDSKGLLDNTTIVMFADHNTYMSNLSNQVKNIYSYSSNNYLELYRVPLMIYDSNIGHKIINKFTTTYDIVPTVLDLFGINYYTNVYYGNSIFSDNESVLYTKAFDVFITDKLLFSNINKPLYKKASANNEYMTTVEEKCKRLLKKIYYNNHIFYLNYFKDQDNLKTYISNIENINK